MGDIVATPLRGAWLGNRGILHRGTDVVAFHRSSLWIICALRHKDWRLPQWQPGHFTVLFFHDEAVALAAGHRPCALCRRDAYNAFRRAAAERSHADASPLDPSSPRDRSLPRSPSPVDGSPGRPSSPLLPDDPRAGWSAKDLDRRLHAERLHPGTHRRRLHECAWPALPDGTFVLLDGAPAIVLGDRLIGWSTTGYAGARARPGSGSATVITPPTTLRALRAGYPVQIDAAATDLASGGGQSAGAATSASGPSSANDS